MRCNFINHLHFKSPRNNRLHSILHQHLQLQSLHPAPISSSSTIMFLLDNKVTMDLDSAHRHQGAWIRRLRISRAHMLLRVPHRQESANRRQPNRNNHRHPLRRPNRKHSLQSTLHQPQDDEEHIQGSVVRARRQCVDLITSGGINTVLIGDRRSDISLRMVPVTRNGTLGPRLVALRTRQTDYQG
jgi:hypothetical protein